MEHHAEARPPRALRLNRRTFGPRQLLVMAIVNQPGVTWDRVAAMDRVHAAVADGADIVDVGGAPTRPGDDVDVPEEIRRTVPFVAAIREAYPDLVISVDTWRHEVGREACAAGAGLRNDSGGGWDTGLVEVAAEFGAGVVCSHALAARAVAAGVEEERILIDPARDFGQNTWHSPEMTRRLGELVATGWPVLVSLPNQDLAGETLDVMVDERLAGTLGTTAVSAWLGARVFRAHHVRQTRHVLSMVSAIRGDTPPAGAVRGLALAGRARLGRDFWFYFSGQAVSQLGGSFTTFALPLLVFKLTHSATNLALTTAAEFVPYVLFGLLLGAVVDRFDRKRLMLGSAIVQALVIAVIPVLAIAGLLRVTDIYAVTFVQSTLGIIFNCGEFAAIPSLVGEQELVTANARIMATNNAGQILGPGLAGALVAFVPVADLLFVDAGSFLVSAGCLALIRRSFNAATPGSRPAGSAIRALLADVREGLAYVWSNPVLRSISIMMALINCVASTGDSQLVLFARRALQATNSEIGFLYAAGAIGIVAVSFVAGPIRQRVSFAVTALGALVLAGLTMTAMALAGSYAAALVLWAASSGFGMLFNINTIALRQAIVPPRLYGRVVSVAQVLAWSAIPLGSLAGAAAINLSGSVTGVYAVIGGLTAAIALAFAFSPVAHGDRYLAEAAERRAGSADAGPSPGFGGAGPSPGSGAARPGIPESQA